MAIEAILNNAAEIGIEEALSRSGSALTTTEKELLTTLTTEELASLKSMLSKLGSQILFQSAGIAFKQGLTFFWQYLTSRKAS
jgi:hypothetical protein